MTSKHFKISLLLIATIILTLGLSISFQSLLAAWTAPSDNPPTCTPGNPGCDEPVNKGPNLQIKGGPLYVNYDNIAATGFVAYGNVGIGTTSPYTKLSVAGDAVIGGSLTASTLIATSSIRAPYFAATNASATSTFAGGLVVQTNKFVIEQSSGNVGIGTTNIGSKLTVGGAGATGAGIYSLGASYGIYAVSSGTAVYGAGGAYGVRAVGTSYGVYGVGGTYGIYGIGTSYDFYGAGPKSYFSSNVGIGVSNPVYKLDVAGDINFTGSLRQNGTVISIGGGANPIIGSSAATCNSTNEGMLRYTSTSKLFEMCNGSAWIPIKNISTSVQSLPVVTCSVPTVTWQGKTYNTVQIGSQCWLRENINYGTRIAVGADSQANDGIVQKKCYSDNESYCTSDGALYSYGEATQYCTNPANCQGVCPTGWRVPTDADFSTLETSLWTTGSCVATRLVEAYTDCVSAGTRLQMGGDSGFDAILAGCIDGGSGYSGYRANTAYFISANTYQSNIPYLREMQSLKTGVARMYGSCNGNINNPTYKAYSVRCIKN